MKMEYALFRGHSCFKREWSGFNSIKPINVIIGRNNSGKSHLLDLVRFCCTNSFDGKNCEFATGATPTEESLEMIFRSGRHGGALLGDHWDKHGKHLVGVSLNWEKTRHGKIRNFEVDPHSKLAHRYDENQTKDRLRRLMEAAEKASPPFKGKQFRHLLADRDIQPEQAAKDLRLSANGRGASNIVRRYIVSSSSNIPRELIQEKLLMALNDIFAPDSRFTEIQIQNHDEKNTLGDWEIFLGEGKKGLIPLSSSGSGLKTVFLVLLNLLVIPSIDGGKHPSDYVFAFEELENNLHPALLRRLLQYVEDYAVTNDVPVFLTTHSSTALDIFGVSSNAQIIHVSHDGESAKTRTVSAHFDKLGVVSELGAKPSDLLQANGVIWVEGPSDMIYVNRWLDIYSEGTLQEGRDYQCAFYGGSLLARIEAVGQEDADDELLNLLQINPNIIVICDGDQNKLGASFKPRVRKIRDQVSKIPNGHVWVTKAREIENYIPGAAMAKALNRSELRDPLQFEPFFPKGSSTQDSYRDVVLNRKSLDKTDFAIQCAPHINIQMMKVRFDWEKQMKILLKKIEKWNS